MRYPNIQKLNPITERIDNRIYQITGQSGARIAQILGYVYKYSGADPNETNVGGDNGYPPNQGVKPPPAGEAPPPGGTPPVVPPSGTPPTGGTPPVAPPLIPGVPNVEVKPPTASKVETQQPYAPINVFVRGNFLRHGVYSIQQFKDLLYSQVKKTPTVIVFNKSKTKLFVSYKYSGADIKNFNLEPNDIIPYFDNEDQYFPLKPTLIIPLTEFFNWDELSKQLDEYNEGYEKISGTYQETFLDRPHEKFEPDPNRSEVIVDKETGEKFMYIPETGQFIEIVKPESDDSSMTDDDGTQKQEKVFAKVKYQTGYGYSQTALIPMPDGEYNSADNTRSIYTFNVNGSPGNMMQGHLVHRTYGASNLCETPPYLT